MNVGRLKMLMGRNGDGVRNNGDGTVKNGHGTKTLTSL